MSHRIPIVAFVLGALLWGGTGTMATPANAAARLLTPACPDVNLRTGTSTSSSIRARLSPGATVTVIASLLGARYGTECGGWVSGSRWVRISQVDGIPVRTTFGVPYLYAASGVLRTAPGSSSATPPTPSPTRPATPAPIPQPTPVPTPIPPPQPAPVPAATVGSIPLADPSVDPLGAELMRLMNLDRVALGLAPYPIDPNLAAIARDAPFACPTNPSMIVPGRARDLALRSYLTHTVPGCLTAGSGIAYRSLDIVRNLFGYTGARSEILQWNTRGFAPTSYRTGCDIGGGNCLGAATPTVLAVAVAQRSFMGSSPHRRSQLNSYERFGCGAAVTPGTTRTYFACLFSNGGPPGSTLITAPSGPPAAPPAVPAPAPVTPPPPPVAPPQPTPAPDPAPAGIAMTPACTDVNLRAGTSTSTAVRARVQPGTTLTVAGAVEGNAWATECPGPVAGSGWYQVSHVGGVPVQALYGVPLVYAATGVLTPMPAG